jgi:DNA ligase (NAD+)
LNLLPKTCPECGSNLLDNGTDQGAPCCVNPDCPVEVRAALARWCAPEAMDIAGANTKVIAQLVAHGLVLDVADFYRLKFDELMELEGMTETTAKNFLATIATSKTRDWWRALAGLGIPHMDARAAEALARNFKNLDDLAGAPLARLTANAGETTAQSFARWFGEQQNRKLIQRLGKAGIF